ncbi:MAG TPA: SH3 domain-containing protein [Phototrophicaceae bacterium]|nr:SH3 domain-containing protein [Phototrophicaceae bacterium]
MPNRSPQRKRTAQLALLLFALGVVMLLLVFSLTTMVAAQDDGTNSTGTPEPTSEFSLNLAPTYQFATPTLDPNQIPSLTGVGGQAVNASVIIRSGPGLLYPQIGSLKQGGWINIVGWSGWTLGRECSPLFFNDLDMWVQVQTGDARGWIARCVLQIRGPLTQLPIVTASGERIMQR